MIKETTCNGTVQLVEFNGIEYVVLCDGTKITREEDNAYGEAEAFFPY